ncbi:MAG: helix-turn-helix domain-containing protein [Paraburkholderia sp.]|nr:MAG: helix-turn-helix domain-containing protein [Paraburkholderia sp.]
MRVAPEIVLSDEERAGLTRLARSGLTSVRLAQRAHIVLLAADGMQNKDIAGQLGVGRVQVSRWRERYVLSRLRHRHRASTARDREGRYFYHHRRRDR